MISGGVGVELTDKIGGDGIDGEVAERHLLFLLIERQMEVIANLGRVQVDGPVQHQIIVDQHTSTTVQINKQTHEFNGQQNIPKKFKLFV